MKSAASTPSKNAQVIGGNNSKTSARANALEEINDANISTANANDEAECVSEVQLKRKIDLRLCTIAGILCSLDLLDSGIISSAAVTSMLDDLDLQGNRFSVSIFIFTIASICFSLPATIAIRFAGPRLFFSGITMAFGLITFCTAFIHSWREMIALRILLGIAMSGIYPGLTYLLSTWYTRREQQLRFAFMQSGEVIVLATGSIVNYGLQRLDGSRGIAGWRWMFLVQGVCAMFIGLITYIWIVDFPENAHRSFQFLSQKEQEKAVERITKDRGDVQPIPFSLKNVLRHAVDLKTYGYACMFFILNTVSTTLSYFTPIILQGGMGFSTEKAIILAAPPYYYAVIPVILSSIIGDRYMRAPVIIFNSISLIVGFIMLGFTGQVAVRYIGVFLATGAYISNWAALSAYYQSNITGQWKRVFTAAVVTSFNGAGGVTGAYIIKQEEAPRYESAIWIIIGTHVVMIFITGLFSLWFWSSNRKQSAGKMLLEETTGFRYRY